MARRGLDLIGHEAGGWAEDVPVAVPGVDLNGQIGATS